MSDDRDLQFEVAQTILRGADQHGFVLAGSGAIREHGIVDRLTRDVDLFTNRYDAAEFDRAVTEARSVLADAGYVVEERRRAEYFAHLNVTAPDGRQVDVDFAYDWRGAEPARLQVGPVLSADDAVASKTNAVYTRLEARDFIDLDAIRSSGRYTDEELLRLVADRDDGFDRAMFAQQLQQVDRIRDDRFAAYGLDSDAAAAMRTRTTRWAAELAEGGEPPAPTSLPAATRTTTLAAIRGHREPEVQARRDSWEQAHGRPMRSGSGASTPARDLRQSPTSPREVDRER